MARTASRVVRLLLALVFAFCWWRFVASTAWTTVGSSMLTVVGLALALVVFWVLDWPDPESAMIACSLIVAIGGMAAAMVSKHEDRMIFVPALVFLCFVLAGVIVKMVGMHLMPLVGRIPEYPSISSKQQEEADIAAGERMQKLTGRSRLSPGYQEYVDKRKK